MESRQEIQIFIDAHACLWLFSNQLFRMSPMAMQTIENSILLISPISLLEIDLLHEIKRITVDGQTMLEALQKEISLQVALDSFIDITHAAKKLTWTRDPFDRLLVAHASLNHSPIITKDRLLHQHYKKCVW